MKNVQKHERSLLARSLARPALLPEGGLEKKKKKKKRP